MQLACDLTASDLLGDALKIAKQHSVGIHHCTAFGLVGGVLGMDPRATALAYLSQSVAGTVSACQRLLPLGQTVASQIQWALKPAMIDAVTRAEALSDVTEAASFSAMIDMASARHPALTTRLFIS